MGSTRPGAAIRAAWADAAGARDAAARKTVYWHRELPPIDAIILGDGVLDAVSRRVAGMLTRHGDLWSACYEDLMANARRRLVQEVERLGGRYAHVLEESIDSRRDARTGESWLHGRFTYTLLA